jgi:hypothetical protein
MMRLIGMDVHRSFAQVAIHEDGEIAETFRVDMEHDAVVSFGRRLRADDETLALRRLVSERAAVVRSIRRSKSRVQAVLHANLIPKYIGHRVPRRHPVC